MKTKLKICGITTPEDARMCTGLGVQMLGFNFFEDSPRYVSPQNAGEIIRTLPAGIKPVGILVRPNLEKVLQTIEISGVKAIQLYEAQNIPDFSIIPVPVILAQSVSGSNVPDTGLHGAAMLLLDAFSPTLLGGSGNTFNWDRIPAEFPREKLILAGGITPANIGEALRAVHPAVIDIASGAEISAGVKDKTKVRQLMQVIRNFNTGTNLS